MKPPPSRLLLSAYPQVIETPVRFMDLDPQAHINNVAVGAFYEEGRSAFFRTALAGVSQRRRFVVARNIFDYLEEGRWPGVITVGTGVLRIGGRSFTFGQALFQDGACIGVAESVSVCLGTGGSEPLPADYRAALEQHMLAVPTHEGREIVGGK